MRIRTAFVGTREGTHGQECGQKGFTLLETAIIMIFVGIVAGMVMLSWSSFAETRRIARARSQLRQMKDCLMRAMLVTEHYPRGADFEACGGAAGPDAWGNGLRWLVGAGSGASALCERDAVVSDLARGQAAATVHDASKVILPSAGGGEQGGVAFVLVSLGRDGRADDATYDRLDTRPWAEILSAGSHPSPPHFQAGGDDIVLAVKAYELSAAIRHAVGP